MGAAEIVSIIIPTYDRPTHLAQLLRYLSGQTFRSIVVADSSPPSVCDTNRATVEAASDRLRIHYLRSGPDVPLISKILQAIDTVDSEYVVVCADDDFIVPRTLEECVRSLESNPEYELAHGRTVHLYASELKKNFAVTFRSPGPGVAESRLWAFLQTPRTIEDQDPFKRLFRMGARGLEFSLSEASTFYAVHRRLNHLRNLQLISKLHYGYFMDWLLNCLDSLQGKSQYVDMLYNVKPYHPPDYSYLSSKAHARIRLHLSDIVVADDFSQEYMYFHKCLTEQLMKVGEAPYEKASKAVHESFTAELALGLNTLATSSIRVPNPNAPRPLTLVQIAYTAARSALFDRHLVDMLRSPFEFALTTYQLRKRFFPLDTLLRRFPSDGAAMESILTCLEYE